MRGSCAHKNFSHLFVLFPFRALVHTQSPRIHLYVLFSFKVLKRPERPAIGLYVCISSCSRCLRTHKDLAYVAKYSYVAFRGACALTKIRHTFVRIPSGSPLEMSCAHTLAERSSTKNIQTVRSHPRLSLHHSTPLPIPLSRLSRACPSCGCFSRVNLGSFH